MNIIRIFIVKKGNVWRWKMSEDRSQMAEDKKKKEDMMSEDKRGNVWVTQSPEKMYVL